MTRKEENERLTENEIKERKDPLDPLSVLTKEVREFRAAQGKTKPSKAQKRKEKKTAKEKKREDEVKEEMKGMVDLKLEENKSLFKKLQTLTPPLIVKEIRSDGHCLYRAIADQLARSNYQYKEKKAEEPYLLLREMAASYMHKNRELFLPFVTDNDGAPLSDADYDAYVKKITSSSEVVWGGHAEIVALAYSLRRDIIVHSASGSPLVVRPETEQEQAKDSSKKSGNKTKEKKNKEITKEDVSKLHNSPLNISYHKHYYSLGEHYNSLIPLQGKSQGEGEEEGEEEEQEVIEGEERGGDDGDARED